MEEQKKEKGAKDYSLFSMIIAGVWIIALTLLKGFKKIELTEKEIIGSGIAIAGVFSPIYFSILMDKIKDIKIGD